MEGARPHVPHGREGAGTEEGTVLGSAVVGLLKAAREPLLDTERSSSPDFFDGVGEMWTGGEMGDGGEATGADAGAAPRLKCGGSCRGGPRVGAGGPARR